jgi:CHAD domain
VLVAHLEVGLSGFPVEQVIGPVKARVQGHFAPQQAAARAALLRALDSQRYFWLLNEMDELIDDKPARTARRIRRAQLAPEGTIADVALHEARKAAKRAR